jgi:hypothetical protein
MSKKLRIIIVVNNLNGNSINSFERIFFFVDEQI